MESRPRRRTEARRDDKRDVQQNTVTISVIKMLYFLGMLFPFASAIGQNEVQLKFCHPNKPIREFMIAKPKICTKQRPTVMTTCDVDIYQIESNYREMFAYICQKRSTIWYSTEFFFGAKTDSVQTVMIEPPSHFFCHEWVNSKNDDSLGKFSKKGENVWSTDNQVTIEYTWPTSRSGNVINGIITKVKLKYDLSRGKLIGALPAIGSCNLLRGSCKLGRQVIIWDYQSGLNCPRVKQTREIINIYFKGPQLKMTRIDIPHLAISIHNFGYCSSDLDICFGSRAMCTNGGIILKLGECKVSSQSNETFNFTRVWEGLDSARAIEIKNYLQETADTVSDRFEKLTAHANFLECKLENSLLEFNQMLAPLYPGKVLTNMLGVEHGQRAAIFSGDILIEIACEVVNATILPDLRYKGLYATRPLVTLQYNNESIMGQILHDGFVYRGVHFLETYKRGRIQIFEIDGSNHLFQNYTLSHISIKVEILRVLLNPFNVTYTVPDYSKLLESLPYDNSRVDFINMALTLHKTNLIVEDLVDNFEVENQFSTDANVSYAIAYSNGHLRAVMKSIIYYITYPIYGAIYFVLIHQSLVWGMVLTLLLIKHYGPNCSRNPINAINKIRSRMLTNAIVQRRVEQEDNRNDQIQNDIEVDDAERRVPVKNDRGKLYPDLQP